MGINRTICSQHQEQDDLFSGQIVYDNVLTGYESPRYICFLNDGVLQFRVELDFEKRSDNPQHPTRMVYRLYTRRHSLLMKVSWRHEN